MNCRHFLSYSDLDGREFALRLCDALRAGQPMIDAWLDKRRLRPGEDWTRAISEAVRTSDSLLFAVTPDSIRDASKCKDEWTAALKFKKPIVPLRVTLDAELPFGLQNRQMIDFATDFDAGLAALRLHLQWLDSDEGRLSNLLDRLSDAERDLRKARDTVTRARIQDDIAYLTQEIAKRKEALRDPERQARNTSTNIERGLERVRTPQRPRGKERTVYIGRPPMISPAHYQNRDSELALIERFLSDSAQRLLTISGRAGVGKTTLVCRALERRKTDIDAMVYIYVPLSADNLLVEILSSLGELVQVQRARAVREILADTRRTVREHTTALLHELSQNRVVVLLDSFEDALDNSQARIRHQDLTELFKALLELPHHPVKLILTTRVAPRDLRLVQPARQPRLELDKGLQSPHAENMLRELDFDGKLGLRDASEQLLTQARVRTLGFPRALELLVGSLSADRYTTLPDLLRLTEGLLPADVLEVLAGEAFERLDDTGKAVIQALAVYSQPVTPVAVDFMLQPWRPDIDSAPVLNRLADAYFATRESMYFSVHPLDQDYALRSLSRNDSPAAGAKQIPSRKALLLRGAEFFSAARLPRSEWKNINDLAPQLTEFKLRVTAGDYVTAANIILEIGYDYLTPWGQHTLMIESLESCLTYVQDRHLRLHMLHHLVLAATSMGEYRKARSYCDEEGELAVTLGDREAQVRHKNLLAICLDGLGDGAQALCVWEDALKLARECGEVGEQAYILKNLSGRYDFIGDFQKAFEYSHNALELARTNRDRKCELSCLLSLGNRYRDRDPATSGRYFEQALSIARNDHDTMSEMAALTGLAQLAQIHGNIRQAIEYLEKRLSFARETGLRSAEATTLIHLGNQYWYLNDFSRAVELYKAALPIGYATEDLGDVECCLGNLGAYHSSVGEYGRALEYQLQALEISRRLHSARGECIGLLSLATLACSRGQLAESVKHAKAALRIATEHGNLRLEASARIRLASIELTAGNYDQVKQYANQALGISRKVDDIDSQTQCLTVLAIVTLLASGGFEEAENLLRSAFALSQQTGMEAVRHDSLASLAFVHLYRGDSGAALAELLTISVRQSDYRFLTFWVLLGVARFRHGDVEAARECFQSALSIVDPLRQASPGYYPLWSETAIVLSGLAIITNNRNLAQHAADCYHTARRITAAAGAIALDLLWLDLLTGADDSCMLKSVRQAAAAAVSGASGI